MLGILAAVAGTMLSLSDDASKLVESLPVAAVKLRDSLHALHSGSSSPVGTLETVQKVASQLEQAADHASRTAPVGRGVQRVPIERSRFDIKDHLWVGTLGLLGMLSQVSIVALITYFLMASGDTFRRKLVKIAGNAPGHKSITLRVLNEINDQIQRHMLVQLFTSALVGVAVATWLCFMAVGLEHAAV